VPQKEALYGGAAGGGKSDALLMCALQYADTPDYAALILRRTYADLSLPGAIMDRSFQWLHGTDAKWNGQEKTWTFSSGATLTFGYLEHENDKYRYQGSEFQSISFDELTQFSLTQYAYMFSRLRRRVNSTVPLRMRAATNPGGLGHEWVKHRFFVEGINFGRVFIPARLHDNPHLDQGEYLESLKELDPVTRKRLEEGDWDVSDKSGLFNTVNIETIDYEPECIRVVRFYDLAVTAKAKADYTAGIKMGVTHDEQFIILDVFRVQKAPADVMAHIIQNAQIDGASVAIRLEAEKAGIIGLDFLLRDERMRAYTLDAKPPHGDKYTRAAPFASRVNAGRVKMVKAAWNRAYVDELATFPLGANDDQVDATSGAYDMLAAIGEQWGIIT